MHLSVGANQNLSKLNFFVAAECFGHHQIKEFMAGKTLALHLFEREQVQQSILCRNILSFETFISLEEWPNVVIVMNGFTACARIFPMKSLKMKILCGNVQDVLMLKQHKCFEWNCGLNGMI